MLRSYHLMDYDWTPLSQNPCWWCRVLLGGHFLNKVRFIFRSIAKRGRKRVSYRWFERRSVRSWKDDPSQTGYCTYESGFYATICWGLSQIDWFVFLTFQQLVSIFRTPIHPTDRGPPRFVRVIIAQRTCQSSLYRSNFDAWPPKRNFKSLTFYFLCQRLALKNPGPSSPFNHPHRMGARLIPTASGNNRRVLFNQPHRIWHPVCRLRRSLSE